MAAREGYEVRHVDIQCAFLNGESEEEIYVEQPPFFNDGTDRVWKLNKTLYGLKQAAREWHKALVHLLGELGFRCSNADAGLYIRKDCKCFIFLWVDDLFVICTSAEVKATVEPILTKFKGRDLGQLEWALGCTITRDLSKKTITMSQRAKVSNLQEKFGM